MPLLSPQNLRHFPRIIHLYTFAKLYAKLCTGYFIYLVFFGTIGKTEMLNFLQDTVLNVQLPVTLRTVNVVSWCQIKKVLPAISTL